jgi:hypothetical protein
MAAWIQHLDEEDQQFIRRFILHSGSLKALANEYGVSYPTVRLRLDRLIAKVRVLDELLECSPFERRLRLLLAEGSITPEVYTQLLTAHQEDLP